MIRPAGGSVRTRGTVDRAGLRFTEVMTGWVALGATDPSHGDVRGRAEGTRLSFKLTIRIDDVQRFVADPGHAACAVGWIECEALGGRLPVQRGEFNLFVVDSPRTRRMLYRLEFADTVAHQLTLLGHKEVKDDAGRDLWLDTSTLFTQVFIGHGAEPNDAVVTAAGILHIRPTDFLRQLMTCRTSGPSLSDHVSALCLFGSFFLGQLWRVYWRRFHVFPGASASSATAEGRA